jgi:hypothetical protein
MNCYRSNHEGLATKGAVIGPLPAMIVDDTDDNRYVMLKYGINCHYEDDKIFVPTNHINSTGFAETYNSSIIRIANTGFIRDRMDKKMFLTYMSRILTEVHERSRHIVHDNSQWIIAEASIA